MTSTSIRGRFVVGNDGHDHCLVPDGEVVFRDETMILNGVRGAFITVVVNGRVVVGRGETPGVDSHALHARAQRQFERLMSHVPDWTPGRPTRDALFPPSFRTVSEISAAAPGAGGAL